MKISTARTDKNFGWVDNEQFSDNYILSISISSSGKSKNRNT